MEPGRSPISTFKKLLTDILPEGVASGLVVHSLQEQGEVMPYPCDCRVMRSTAGCVRLRGGAGGGRGRVVADWARGAVTGRRVSELMDFYVG